MGASSNNSSSKELLGLEQKNPKFSSLESTLRVCNATSKPNTSSDGKFGISPLTKSPVIGKVKDFLGVMAEANEKLLRDAKENSTKEYDIETLTGNEAEYIEMDLVLGVADLHTPEAVAAAESAMSGFQPTIPIALNSDESDTESSVTDSDDDEDSDGEDTDSGDDGNDKANSPKKMQEPNSDKSNPSSNSQPKKRQKLIQLL